MSAPTGALFLPVDSKLYYGYNTVKETVLLDYHTFPGGERVITFEGVRPEDVKGKFESGILQISLPKAEQKKLPAQTMIAIE